MATFPHTLRVLKLSPGRWSWVILRGRDAAWQFELGDVLAHSDHVFASPEQARDDALSNYLRLDR
jgi:hypothetical protein